MAKQSTKKSVQEKEKEPFAYWEHPNEYHYCGGDLYGAWIPSDCVIFNPKENKYTKIGTYFFCSGRDRTFKEGRACGASKIVLDEAYKNEAFRALAEDQRRFIFSNPRREYFKHEIMQCKIDYNLLPRTDEGFTDYSARLKLYVKDMAA